MPIKINLLAEAQADEDLRKRDPVKRAIFIGVLLVVLSLVWFSSILLEHIMASQQLAQAQAGIESHTNDYAVVQVKLKKIAEAQKKLDSLQKLSAGRFLQGNLMNAFQQVYVPNVQLTHLRVDQSYAGSTGTSAVTNLYGVTPGRAGATIERVVITMDAKDFSANGDQVNRFQDVFSKQGYFKSNLATNGIRLANLSPPQTSYDSKPFVLFTLECRFPDKSR
jgi:hypothetical protein